MVSQDRNLSKSEQTDFFYPFGKIMGNNHCKILNGLDHFKITIGIKT